MKSSFCSQHKRDPSLLRELYELPQFDWPLSVTPSVRSGSSSACRVAGVLAACGIERAIHRLRNQLLGAPVVSPRVMRERTLPSDDGGHSPLIGTMQVVDLIPCDGHRDREPGPGTDRECGDRRCPAPVA